MSDKEKKTESAQKPKKRKIYTIENGQVVQVEVQDMSLSAEEREERKKREEMRKWRRLRLRRALMILLFAALVAVILYTGYDYTDDPAAPALGDVIPPYSDTVVSGCDMIIHAIDVGQGDCALVQGGGANILIDAGENGKGGLVIEYLLEHDVKTLDWLICTHPHSDHIGGVDTVLCCSEIETKNVMMPEIPDELVPTSRTFEDVLNAIENTGVPLYAAECGKKYTFGAMSMTVLTPIAGNTYTDLNDYSVSLRFDCGDVSFLACGDISTEVERQLISAGADIDCNIMKASHHGSAYSNCREYLTAVSPDYVYCSSGAGNTFGHPSDEFIENLERLKIPLARTDKKGSIVYSSDGRTVWIKTEY